MKKITMLLAVCMTAIALIIPAFASTPSWDWADYVSRWKVWFTQAQAEAPAESEAPVESAVQEETEVPEEAEAPEETEPVAEEYTIRYDANGGYFWSQYASPAISNSKSYKVTAGNTHKVISAPQRTSYTFGGWADADGNLYYTGDIITPDRDMTLKAQWK